jgi:hypothetical protein
MEAHVGQPPCDLARERAGGSGRSMPGSRRTCRSPSVMSMATWPVARISSSAATRSSTSVLSCSRRSSARPQRPGAFAPGGPRRRRDEVAVGGRVAPGALHPDHPRAQRGPQLRQQDSSHWRRSSRPFAARTEFSNRGLRQTASLNLSRASFVVPTAIAIHEVSSELPGGDDCLSGGVPDPPTGSTSAQGSLVHDDEESHESESTCIARSGRAAVDE